MELQKLAMVEVKTKDPFSFPIQVRVALDENVIPADTLLAKICQRCGLKESSYKYFSLCKGDVQPVHKYKPSDKIHVPAADLFLEKWCLNPRKEKKLIASDPKVIHLLFIQAKHDVESGKLLTTPAEKIKLDDCLDPEFLIEEQYVLLCQKLPDYYTILVQGCTLCDNIKLKSYLFERNGKVNIFVSLYGMKIVSESADYVILSWYEVIKWQYDSRNRTVSYIIQTEGDYGESKLCVKTSQAEYLLAATLEGVKELLAEDENAEPFHSSMITQTPDGVTQWQNSLFCPSRAKCFKNKIWI